MKLLRYGDPGRERPALLDADGVIRDLSFHISDIAGASLWPNAHKPLHSVDASTLPAVCGNPRTGPCVGVIGKIIGVGLDYRDHAAESNKPVPSEPVLFTKATSSIVGPDDDVEIPSGSEKTDWEVELGVVIGKPGKYIPEHQALEHICGYCIVNDISERAYQLERGGQWDKGKGCDTFAPIGPWLVTTDEVLDPQSLDLWLEVDGQPIPERQHPHDDLWRRSPGLYISSFMSLHSGDIISSGTPPGVGLGQKPTPIYLRPGQTMRLDITGLGVQQERTVAATAG